MLASSMRNIVIALLTFAGSIDVFAGSRFDAKTWQTVHSYDVRALSQNFDTHVGELVEVHFNFRGKDIHHMKPNWYESSVWQPDPRSRKHFTHVRVMVSKSDLKAFKSFPTDSGSTGDITVYGKILRDSEAKFVFIRLIGRNTIVDPGGNVTVTW